MINFTRVRTIINKEWAEMFKNRLVLFTIVLLPLVFTALPLVILFVFSTNSGTAGASSADVPAQFAQTCGNLLSAADCMMIYMLNEFLLLYLMMPVIIPITIAAYSIVGEKTTHSLEPLLATPITTEELLLGKGLAAVIPGVLATVGSFGLFLIISQFLGISRAVQRYILSPTWLLAILLVGPLIAVAAVNFAIFVSSRTSDPRVAEQVSSILILPLIILLFTQISGLITINVPSVLIAAAIMVLVDIAMVIAGARLFQRETILTRWK